MEDNVTDIDTNNLPQEAQPVETKIYGESNNAMMDRDLSEEAAPFETKKPQGFKSVEDISPFDRIRVLGLAVDHVGAGYRNPIDVAREFLEFVKNG